MINARRDMIPSPRMRFRLGFTLVELLVVVSLIGLLVALGLPAVQAAREAARRTQCEANLKQIGLALHNYQATHQTFPYNWGYPRVDPVLGRPYHIAARPYSALTRILPYLEQTTLYDSMNFSVETYPGGYDGTGFQSPANLTAYATNLAVYLCPSDGAATPTPHGCNYRGSFGVGPHIATNQQTYDSGNGFFTFPATLGPGSFPDGLAHTVAYSERLRGTGVGASIDTNRNFGNIQVMMFCTERDADNALKCARIAATQDWPSDRAAGFTWFYGDYECTAYNHAQEPNGRIPDAITSGLPHGIVTARSNHPGGVNSLMADGSVRFVGETIGRPIWRALGTRNGDELVE